MRSASLLRLAVIIAALLGVQSPATLFADDDLLGYWEVVTCVNSGENLPDNVGQLVFIGSDKLVLNALNPQEDFDESFEDGVFEGLEYPYVIDTKATPHTIDVTLAEQEGLSYGIKILGIYKIEGDMMTVCSVLVASYHPNDPRKIDQPQRPTEFSSPVNSWIEMQTLRRVEE